MKISSLKHLAYLLQCKTSEQELLLMCRQLCNHQREYDEFYYREKIEESIGKNGKVKLRIINPSLGRLKFIQARIKKIILDKIPFPKYVQGAAKGKSNISNAAQHLGNKFKFTTDIKRFFPSITPKQVYIAFCEQGCNPEVARVLTILSTFKGRVPQGASTSSGIANMVFLTTDQKINEVCDLHSLTYTRYVDDITISSPNDFKEIIPTIIKLINDAGFMISIPKTFYGHMIDITGIRVLNNGMRPNEKFFKKLIMSANEASFTGRINYLKRVKSAQKCLT